jgi:transcriptional regulator with XRE-family HTH domain
MDNNQRKEWAYLLFVKEEMTQKEIAGKVGVSEQTISKWVTVGEWDTMRVNILQSKKEQLMRYYRMLDKMYKILDDENRVATKDEINIISKINRSIKELETNTSIRMFVDVFRQYFEWLRATDLPEAQRQIPYADTFIKTRLSK